MTPEDIRSELEREPFVPFRLHLVSGDKVEVRSDGVAFMLHNAVLVFQNPQQGEADAGYDVIALRNIERLEQLRVGGPSVEGSSRRSR